MLEVLKYEEEKVELEDQYKNIDLFFKFAVMQQNLKSILEKILFLMIEKNTHKF